jgi:TolB-like protein/cytochrome c-type biogenesis protein CcmH/NrfG
MGTPEEALEDLGLHPGDRIADRLEVVRLLGAGGMGGVFEALHLHTGRHVALKVLHGSLAKNAAACQRFLQEALACGSVRHPNVVDIYDAGTHQGKPYIVMELLDGESLGERLTRRHNLAVREALRIVAEAASGLACVHGACIVHRDLKPDNLFLAKTGATEQVKVLDFGISKLGDGAAASVPLHRTRTGMIVGTPYYMSPEQARGERDIDGACDVYALGAVLYHALTGRPPYMADNYNALLLAILQGNRPELRSLRPEVPPPVEALVDAAMADDARVRPSVADMEAALRRELSGLGDTHVGSPVPSMHATSPAPRLSFGASIRNSSEPGSGRPTVAVLPFTNMSGDAEQEFFVDGLTEDIITELSRFRHLFVISRTSSFAFKDRRATAPEVARELGAQYILEGSVRKAGTRVRVTVQLIDVGADRHIWAERYDRQLEDIFAIQDEVAKSIVATLPGRLDAASYESVERKRPESLDAYEHVLAAKVLHHRSDREANAQALAMVDRAIALEPSYAHARAWRACILGQAWAHGWMEDSDATLAAIEQEVQRALQVDENDSDVHRILAAIHLTRNDLERALHHQERGLRLNPNNDLLVVQQGEALTWLGRAEEGIDWIKRAMRLNPYHPARYWSHLGRAQFVARRYAEAIESFHRHTAPDHTHHAFLAACHAQLGHSTEGQAHARQLLTLSPDFQVTAYLDTLHYTRPDDQEHHRQALRAAGLPD